MSAAATPADRVIIVGAGASFPYGLPMASGLIERSVERINELMGRLQMARLATFRPYTTPKQYEQYMAKGSELKRAVLVTLGSEEELIRIAKAFKENLVHQNLDDFVRDHPSFTNAVSMLISVALFEKMYSCVSGDDRWMLQDAFRVGGLPPQTDWMRSLVGVLRPKASTGQPKVGVISFNYDGLLERSMRMYWPGTEVDYPSLDDSVEFIYPHGKFSDLPDVVTSPVEYLEAQRKNIRLGDNKDEAARSRAQELVATAKRIYVTGFSFSQSNLDILKLNDDRIHDACVIQNFENLDRRLALKLDYCGVAPWRRETCDMNGLIRHGFFER